MPAVRVDQMIPEEVELTRYQPSSSSTNTIGGYLTRGILSTLNTVIVSTGLGGTLALSWAFTRLGAHMEDLEEDRKLGPREASTVCDLLSMHGYPIYARWAEGPTDEHLLPFLAHVTRWLGESRELLFSEFGLPTYRRGDPSGEQARRQSHTPLVEEQAAAAYQERALVALHRAGCAGAMLWCYTDYDSALWEKPPLDVAVHERSFGLWRADGSPKPSVAAVAAFAGADRVDNPDNHTWIDIEPDEFSRDPGVHLQRLYRRYRKSGGPTSP